MSLPRICPSCQCIFHQDFVCTTCGAEKLRAAVTQLAYRDSLEYPKKLAAMTCELDAAVDKKAIAESEYHRIWNLLADAQADNARLREALEKLASVEGNGVARLALATKEYKS